MVKNDTTPSSTTSPSTSSTTSPSTSSSTSSNTSTPSPSTSSTTSSTPSIYDTNNNNIYKFPLLHSDSSGNKSSFLKKLTSPTGILIIFLIVVVIAVIIYYAYLGKSDSSENSSNSSWFGSKSSNSENSSDSSASIVKVFAIIIIIITLTLVYLYYEDHAAITAMKKWFKKMFGKSSKSSDTKPPPPPNNIPEIKLYKEVFNIPGNDYSYSQAESICTAYGAELATYDELEKAYGKGAEWCNYGWSKGQMALFPTQKKTFDKLQKIKGHEHDCGRPGINGGYMANPNIRFGINCYGHKPKRNKLEKELMENTTPYPLTQEEINMEKQVDYWKTQLPNIIVSPFNSNTWSKI